jgi:cyanate permease
VLALIDWASQLPDHDRPQAQAETRPLLWNQPLVWQVSLFMACQSTVF